MTNSVLIMVAIMVLGSEQKDMSRVDRVQSQPSTTQSEIDKRAVARLARLGLPWKILLEDPEAKKSNMQRQQVEEASREIRLARYAREKGYDRDPRYTQLSRATDVAMLAEITRLHLAATVPVGNAEREAYVAAHPGRYDQFRLRHIFIALKNARDGSNRTEDEARLMAAEVSRRLAQGTPFDELARTLSDDQTTSGEGGELSTMLGGMLAGPFFTAVRDAKDGQTLAPVRGEDGYHIIHVDQRIPGDANTASWFVEEDIRKEKLPALLEAAITNVSG